MANQGTSRREAMQILAYASVAATFGGFRRWVFACNHEVQAAEENVVTAGPYEPQFFLPWEYRMVEQLAELIIPNDGQPGAGEAGVSEFIDFMMANSADVGMFTYQPPSRKEPVSDQERIPDAMQSRGDIQNRFRFGLSWLEGHTKLHFKQGFLDCTPEQQTEILEHLAYKDRYRPNEEEGRAFFELMRRYTVMGFYTTRIGLEQLDYKGLETFWTAMPPCPHREDPEHLHLKPPVM
jgi:gluconate 2-dehydrogenase gamma chain